MRTIILMLLIATVPAGAHFPDGVVYAAFPFPDDQLPVLDGDLSDWDIVPAGYILNLSHHEEVKAKQYDNYDTTDLNIRRVTVGWNDTHNRLYFMAEVYDDVVRFHKDNPDSLDTYFSRLRGAYVHGDDIWEIVIDADHGGELVVGHSEDEDVEMRKRSAYTQNYHLYMPPINGQYWHWLWGKATWTKDPAWSDVGWAFAGANLDAGTVTYECYLTPFDDLHPDGPDSSVVHDLKAGSIIGLSWAFLDADDSEETFDAFWSLSKDRVMKMYCMGQYLVDFVLMPPTASDPDAE